MAHLHSHNTHIPSHTSATLYDLAQHQTLHSDNRHTSEPAQTTHSPRKFPKNIHRQVFVVFNPSQVHLFQAFRLLSLIAQNNEPPTKKVLETLVWWSSGMILALGPLKSILREVPGSIPGQTHFYFFAIFLHFPAMK